VRAAALNSELSIPVSEYNLILLQKNKLFINYCFQIINTPVTIKKITGFSIYYLVIIFIFC